MLAFTLPIFQVSVVVPSSFSTTSIPCSVSLVLALSVSLNSFGITSVTTLSLPINSTKLSLIPSNFAFNSSPVKAE